MNSKLYSLNIICRQGIYMELLQIKYFKAIAETENISKAAGQLYIAQPSLSQTLKRLEDELGTPLFDRTGKRITLNGADKIFLRYCNEVLTSLQNAELELGEYKNNGRRDVNIAVSSASLLIPDIVGNIRESYPDIMPHIFQSGCTEWDIKIYSDHRQSRDNILLKEPIGAVFPRDHFLADKRHITINDLEKCAFISLGKNCDLYNIISHFCENASFEQNISMYVDTPSLMRELLKMNMGVAFVPQYTWHSFYSGSLEFRAVKDMPMSRCVRIEENREKYAVSAVKNCRRIIEDYFAGYARQFE